MAVAVTDQAARRTPRGPGWCVAAAAIVLCGCVRRTITITTEPPGALAWLNDRELGRTPIDVDFEYYGTYDVRIERAGYEPLMTSGDAKAPWWDTVGLDLVCELIPGTLHARTRWHYVLEPKDDDPEALVGRARELRGKLAETEAAGDS